MKETNKLNEWIYISKFGGKIIAHHNAVDNCLHEHYVMCKNLKICISCGIIYLHLHL